MLRPVHPTHGYQQVLIGSDLNVGIPGIHKVWTPIRTLCCNCNDSFVL